MEIRTKTGEHPGGISLRGPSDRGLNSPAEHRIMRADSCYQLRHDMSILSQKKGRQNEEAPTTTSYDYENLG